MALAGSIPSQPLGTEEFEEITISGSSAISDPYEGHFWTSWSPNYGCAEVILYVNLNGCLMHELIGRHKSNGK